jgi:transposase IS66 family protein
MNSISAHIWWSRWPNIFWPDSQGAAECPLAIVEEAKLAHAGFGDGYNRVTDVDGRSRSSCLAHVRRRFFEALTSHPAAAHRALDLILDIYRVEHEAKKRGRA